MADMPVNDLVRALREALGQDTGDLGDGDPGDAGGGDAPVWIDGGAKREFDADAMLARGETPVGKVGEALLGMAEGDVVLIRSTFQVAPLIDALRGKGHEVFNRRVGDDAWEAWVRKR